MNYAVKALLLLVTISIVACFPTVPQQVSRSSALSNPEPSTHIPANSVPTTLEDLEDPADNLQSQTPSRRSKRALIFRPLFVYRQQELKKQRLQEQREGKATTAKPPPKPQYASNYGYVN